MENLFSDRQPDDVLAVTLLDGRELQGSYLHQGGMHFLHVVSPDHPLGKTILGPFDDVAAVRLLKSREDVREERLKRSRGALYPGRAPKTADDYQYRLETLGKAFVREQNRRRAKELELQFHDVADQIRLAQGKRAWIIGAARWSLKSNEEPKLSDLWHDDVASIGFMCRPRPQDFDPAPLVRRKRVPLPAHIVADPRSIPNMLSALKRAGLKASIALAGDPVWDRANLQVDVAPGRLHRFSLKARRLANGQMHWDCGWGGNDNRTAARRYRMAMKGEAYARLIKILEGQ